jgi:hypothetical protein
MITQTREYAVCQDCIVWLANADASGIDTDKQSVFLARLEAFETNSAHPGHVVAVGDALGFSQSRCDACGSLAGDRFLAVRLTELLSPPVVAPSLLEPMIP